jgi:PBSX family phage terminase large subunit
MSPEGARLYATTNPDTPYHYLKTDYIDNPDLVKAGDIWTELFVLDDNLSLSEEKKAQYHRMYTGVFYQRFILGQWVIAQGAIYKDVLGPHAEYDDDSRPPGLYSAYQARYIAVDYGTTNPTVFLDVYQYDNVFWEDREYRWDSRKEMRQKTDMEYADDLESFVGPNRRGVILVIDPSAASFKAECIKRGFQVKDAKNDVLEGIRRTAAAIKNGKYRYHKRNVFTNKEMVTYAWDEKAAKRGEECPIKENDHGPDARRYCVHTMMPAWMVG